MYATNHFERAFLNTMLGNDLTAPSTLYLGLLLSNPGEAGAGTEIVYAGYTRQPITFSVPAYDSSLSAVGMKNLAQITFPLSDAAAGTVTHIGLYDSPTGGNLWAYGEARENLSIGTREQAVILPGEIVYYMTGSLSQWGKTRFLNVLRGQSITGFTPHLSLWNGSPESGGAELAGLNYARVPLQFSAPAEQSSGQMRITTTADAAFPRPSSNWGSWSHTAICTALTGGSPLWILERPTPYLIKTGYMPICAAGDVNVFIH